MINNLYSEQYDQYDSSAGRPALKRSQTTAPGGSGEGKANRISQYKKQTLFDKPERTPPSSILRREDTMEMEDDSFGNSPRIRPESDIKQAVMNMYET